MTQRFNRARQLLSECAGEQLSTSIETGSRPLQGDIRTVAEFEGVEERAVGQHAITETTVDIATQKGEIYATVIIQRLGASPAGLIELVEVVHTKHRGAGAGRCLHEAAIEWLDKEADVERIYTKIENTRMLSANIETGFQQIDGLWYRRS